MFLQSLQNAFEQSSISKVAYAIVYMVLIILALNSFHVAMEYTKETIAMMTSFLMALDSTITCFNCYLWRTYLCGFLSPSPAFFNEYERNLNSICGITIIIFCSDFKHCEYDDRSLQSDAACTATPKLCYWYPWCIYDSFSGGYFCTGDIIGSGRWGYDYEQPSL